MLFFSQAMFQIANGTAPVSQVNLPLILGDKTGFLDIQNKQKFYVEFSEYHTIRSSPPVNFLVEFGSELWLSADFRVVGATQPALKVKGHLSGVYNLTASEGRHIYFDVGTTNARMVDGKYVNAPKGMLLYFAIVFFSSLSVFVLLFFLFICCLLFACFRFN